MQQRSAQQARIAAHLTARYQPSSIPSRLAAADPVVYYLEFGPLIKIGTTLNLPQRLKSLPFDRVLATEPGYYDLEARRHREFAHLRHRGEWFNAGPDLLAHIDSLARGIPAP